MAAADKRLADELPRRDIDGIIKASEQALATIECKEPKTSAVTGEQLPPPGELASIRRENLLRAFAERRELLRDTLSANDVAKMFGVSRQTPHDRVTAGTLLAVKDHGKLLFPSWQFDPDGPDGVIDGLPDVLREMGGPLSPLARAKWFLTPKSLMGGRSPLDALRAGEVDSVITEARAIGAS